MTPKNGVKIGAVAVVVICLASVSYFVFMHEDGGKESIGPLTSTIFDLKEQDGMPHFYFESDYLFDEYLEEGSSSLYGLALYAAENITAGKVIKPEGAPFCSAFKVENDSGDGFLMGRNFDYPHAEPAIVHTNPDDGYSSVSIVSLSLIGGAGESNSSRAGNTLYNFLPYIPLDGVNEKGVFVCVNVVTSAESVNQKEPDKVPIFLVSAIRLILDHAATTQEAVDLVMKYNLNYNVNCHFLVCDRSGDSRAIEIVNNRTVVTPTDIMTNHYITEDGNDVPINDSSRGRYDILEATLESKPRMTQDDVRDALGSVSLAVQDGNIYTRWSVVYDLNACTGVVWTISPQGEDGPIDYGTPHSISI